VIAFTVIGGLPEFNTTMLPTMSGMARPHFLFLAGLASRLRRRETSSATSPRNRRASASRRWALCSIFFISASVNRSLPLACGLAAMVQPHARTALCIIIDKLNVGAFKGATPLMQC
jgi:hypothetical protein